MWIIISLNCKPTLTLPNGGCCLPRTGLVGSSGAALSTPSAWLGVPQPSMHASRASSYYLGAEGYIKYKTSLAQSTWLVPFRISLSTPIRTSRSVAMAQPHRVPFYPHALRKWQTASWDDLRFPVSHTLQESFIIGKPMLFSSFNKERLLFRVFINDGMALFHFKFFWGEINCSGWDIPTGARFHDKVIISAWKTLLPCAWMNERQGTVSSHGFCWAEVKDEFSPLLFCEIWLVRCHGATCTWKSWLH